MFFFKQKTAYEMRISDWSSDVCSSDLAIDQRGAVQPGRRRHREAPGLALAPPGIDEIIGDRGERIGVAVPDIDPAVAIAVARGPEEDRGQELRPAGRARPARSEERRVGEEGGSAW